MTPAPQTSPSPSEREDSHALTIVKWLGMLIFASFALGFAVAGIESVLETPDSLQNWLITAAGTAGLALSVLFALRLIRSRQKEPLSRSEKRGNYLLIASGLLGGVLSLAMIVGTSMLGAKFDLFSNDPIPGVVATIAIGTWLCIMPWISLAWYRTVDEIERDNSNFGALLALYSYATLAPTWWLGWRGGFLPEPQDMLIYIAVIAIWSIGWLWRRIA